MFGYATDETEECMPLTVVLAHRLNQKIAELRRSGELSWARPDSKTQVSSFLPNHVINLFMMLKYTFEYLLIHDDCNHLIILNSVRFYCIFHVL